jgi:hypothetical protein
MSFKASSRGSWIRSRWWSYAAATPNVSRALSADARRLGLTARSGVTHAEQGDEQSQPNQDSAESYR